MTRSPTFTKGGKARLAMACGCVRCVCYVLAVRQIKVLGVCSMRAMERVKNGIGDGLAIAVEVKVVM